MTRLYQQRRAARLLRDVAAESQAALAALDTVQLLLDERLSRALQLIVDSSAEHARMVRLLRGVEQAPDVETARRLARGYLAELGR